MNIMTNPTTASIAGVLIAALTAIWCLLIADRKGMDRFTALLAGAFFSIFAVIYYNLAKPEKDKPANPARLYALVALLIGAMISAAIIWAK